MRFIGVQPEEINFFFAKNKKLAGKFEISNYANHQTIFRVRIIQ